MSSKPSVSSRPLSPFMLGQYYRFQISSVLSFAHRITGIGLAIGSILLAAWVLCAVAGPGAYAAYTDFARSIIGQILMLCWSWALLYHLCNGVRHLVWDTGHAFEKAQVDLGGWVVVAASIILTAAVWIVAYCV